jgi:dihydrofolate reductase
MQVRLYIGVSIDGFIAATDHVPAWEGLHRPGEVDAEMYGYHTFMQEISTVIMGRTTYDGCVEAFGNQWPWSEKQIFVLTSHTLPASRPDGVTAWQHGAEALLAHLRTSPGPGHIKILGGAKTIQAFRAIGAIDRFDVFVMPVLLGDGIPFSPPGATPQELHLESYTRFANGAIKLVYTPIRPK